MYLTFGIWPSSCRCSNSPNETYIGAFKPQTKLPKTQTPFKEPLEFKFQNHNENSNFKTIMKIEKIIPTNRRGKGMSKHTPEFTLISWNIFYTSFDLGIREFSVGKIFDALVLFIGVCVFKSPLQSLAASTCTHVIQ